MITLTGVSKKFETAKSAVLDNINLQIKKGEFVYVVGDSGAGKTTLLKMLYGEEKPSKGNISVGGRDLSKFDSSELQELRRKVGVIFQDLRLVDELTGFENVVLSLDVLGEKPRKRTIEDALTVVGAQGFASKKVRLLSGGEKQRIAAARAIVRNPEILIADEPTGSLDREHTWGLMDLFQKIHLRGTTVIIATHDREIVRRVRRKSCVLKAGKLFLEDGVCLF